MRLIAETYRVCSGGAERDRTVDLRLAKPALSQLSYSPLCIQHRGHQAQAKLPLRPLAHVEQWARAELNCRPHAYQACALTT